jgi:hypothetical protein
VVGEERVAESFRCGSTRIKHGSLPVRISTAARPKTYVDLLDSSLIFGPEFLREAWSFDNSEHLIQHRTNLVQLFIDGIVSFHDLIECVPDVVGAFITIQVGVDTIASLGDYDHLRGANVVWCYRLLGSRLLRLGLIELEPVKERFKLWNSLSGLSASTLTDRGVASVLIGALD